MERISRLKAEMEELGYDSVLVFEPTNIFYLTGFWGEGISLLDKNELSLIIPKLETERAKKSANCTIIESERGNMLNSLPNIEGRVCTDCNDYNIMKSLENKFNLVYDKSIFDKVRMIKDDDEIKEISKAASLLDKLFAFVENKVVIGMSELEIQALIMYEGLRLGLQPASYKFTLYPLIIASGKNSALPHAQPTSRRIKKGDLLTIDLTLRYNGYVADTTRTFAIGNISNEKRLIYNIVKEAQEKAIENIREGMLTADLDKISRDVIDKYGYSKYFIHSTGHGIGLDVHEPPWIKANDKTQLERNMAITIEPGIYIDNKYGVRIEDSIIVSKKAKVLNKYTKELVII